MQNDFQRVYERHTRPRYIDIIGALSTIVCIIVARSVGAFEFLELYAFDKFMRSRPQEAPDSRILIVGINEDDIKKIGHPNPDGKIASLIQKLKTHQAAAIGLDIYRDLPVPPGTSELRDVFKTTQNLIAVNKIAPDNSGKTVNPPPDLPSEQIGFADAVPDSDGKQRRALLGASDLKGEWQLSLSLRLARKYLEKKGIELAEVDGDELGMKFGSTKLKRFLSNSGGYVRADDGGSQILINFRSHPQPFKIVSFSEVLNPDFATDKIKDKIVLIGIISPSAKDYVISQAVKSKPGKLDSFIYGVEVQAHVVSQIISAVENKRTFIYTWSDTGEYLFIIVFGLIGIFLGRRIDSSHKLLFTVSIISLITIGSAYLLLLFGWWIPIVPSILVFLSNGLVIAVFFKYDEALRTRIQDRQIVIDQVFETIHGGPLQKLSMILRNIDSSENLDKQQLSSNLRELNQELRQVHQLLQREVSNNDEIFYLRTEQQLSLEQPIHQVLYQVYCDVLERNNPEFKTLKLKIVDFQQLDEHNLSFEQKRGLCRFLEEGLTNAGKYAKGITRLDVICKQSKGVNMIRVGDNGCGMENINTPRQGFGTKQAENLARQLRGNFQRFPNSSQGTVYQLIWSASKLRFWLF